MTDLGRLDGHGRRCRTGVYSELAAMFPDKSGGIAIYAHEGWRKYSTLVGPVATLGYWFAWSSRALVLRAPLSGTSSRPSGTRRPPRAASGTSIPGP